MSQGAHVGRVEFSESVKQLLAKRAGFRCSICSNPTIGPHSEPGKSINLGEASHIFSAAPDGPRPNPSLTPEERAAPDNGIHLCKIHARTVDVDVAAYPAEKLKDIKRIHEHKIRASLIGQTSEFDPDFLNAHEVQVVHSRGEPALSDLWVKRFVAQPQAGEAPTKHDAVTFISKETGTVLISGDQWTGRTSLLKRITSLSLNTKNCVWINGKDITETVVKDPLPALVSGYQKINRNSEGLENFLGSDTSANLIVIDDLHLCSLNIATKRKFLSLLQGLAGLVLAVVNEPFFIEIVAVAPNDSLRLSSWRLLDLTRAQCGDLVANWCRFRSESIDDQELDGRIANAQANLEILFGRKLMPRHPVFVLTALQGLDAGSPMDTSVGSFGGLYETVIHLAIAKNAANQAVISNERAYMEELAYWCEFKAESQDRTAFNEWFAERKGIRAQRALDLEQALLSKNFIAKNHQGFRFNYQKHYFLASFLRNNPSRDGAQDYIRKLITHCWNEEYANTALFLAYLQPSSFLVQALLEEVRKLFSSSGEFDIGTWAIDAKFPKNFFRGLSLTDDPEANRRTLAERLDETSPVYSSECRTSSANPAPENEDQVFRDFLKSYHLIKLVGQLIRNSPIAFDATQKQELISSGFSLALRVITFVEEMCTPAALQTQALNELRERVLKKNDRAELEAAITGVVYNLYVFLTFSVFRHACVYLSHPDLALIYQKILHHDAPKNEKLSHKVIACGINYELRSPDSNLLRKIYHQLPPAGQVLIHVWTWMFLSFNRVQVTKRQAILDSVEMSVTPQLLLPRGLE